MVTINRQRLLLDHKNFDSNPISKLPILQAFYRLSTCQNHCGGLLVGIPKTIDNDVGITERSIGFDTAVNIATEALDRLHFTAASHNRVIVVEVMGRDAGHIAEVPPYKCTKKPMKCFSYKGYSDCQRKIRTHVGY